MTAAAIYARVSSARQAKDQTIGSQLAALREHARGSGRTISSVAVQALEEFLHRARGDRPGR